MAAEGRPGAGAPEAAGVGGRRRSFAVVWVLLVGALGGCCCAGDQAIDDVRALPGDAKVLVEWAAHRARGYEVHWRAGTGVRLGAGSLSRVASSPLLLSGLTNGQLYCFRVAAVGWNVPRTSDEVCARPQEQLRPRLDRLIPTSVPSGTPSTLRLVGEGFAAGATVMVDGTRVPTTLVDRGRLEAQLGPLGRGGRQVWVEQAVERSGMLGLEVTNRPPVIAAPADPRVDEEQTLQLSFAAVDPEGDPVRVHATRLPPGARWDQARAVLTFRPTFIQGGASHPCTVVAVDGQGGRSERSFEIRVADTIAPPAPRVVSSRSVPGGRILTLSQRTDGFLDSPGWAGREFEAQLAVPEPLRGPLPVRVQLHGFDGAPEVTVSSGELRLHPADPLNSYWWGFAESLPGGEPRSGRVPDFTARRVMALVEWVLDEYPEADPERVYLAGASMGGAGALTLGLRYARHFAWVEAWVAQTIPRLHRPSRISQLRGLWGAPELDLDAAGGLGVWSTLDLTRELADSPEAREQLLIVKHGKDDPVIHFGAAVTASELTGRSFYDSLQQRRVGHLVVWDEASHDSPDPVLGRNWWGGWSPHSDAEANVGRARPFPAFSSCSVDRDPGVGGNGRRDWSEESGFAGAAGTAGDTGWGGEVAGSFNRGLRWRRVEESTELARVELRVLDGSGSAAPRAGYPTTGERLDGRAPVRVDVTLRRLQAFRLAPGERVAWSFGAGFGGLLEADAEGLVTVPAVPLTTDWTELRLERR